MNKICQYVTMSQDALCNYIYSLESISILKLRKLYLVWYNGLCHIKIKAKCFRISHPVPKQQVPPPWVFSVWKGEHGMSTAYRVRTLLIMSSTQMMLINFQDWSAQQRSYTYSRVRSGKIRCVICPSSHSLLSGRARQGSNSTGLQNQCS